MMRVSVLITIIIFVFYSLIVLKKEKIFSPIKIYMNIWTIAMISYLISYPRYNKYHSSFLLVIILGTILFILGHILGKIIFSKKNFSIKNYKLKNNFLFKLMIMIGFIAAILYIYKSVEISKMSNYGGFLTRIRTAKNYFNVDCGILEYFSTFNNSILVYWLVNKKEINFKRNKFYFIILSISVIVFAILSTGRGFIFNIILAIFIIKILVTYRDGNEKLIKRYILILCTLLLSVFITFSIVLNKQGNGTIIDNINQYISGSIESFDFHLNKNNEYKFGKNTFRIFFAISNKILDTNYDVSLIDEFPQENMNNTYTIYKTYIDDFGILGVLIQFFIGLISTYTYEMAKIGSKKHMFSLAFLIFPLIMQIMLDQYISISSYWIQICFYKFLMFNIINKKESV